MKSATPVFLLYNYYGIITTKYPSSVKPLNHYTIF
jgi:hypothetical protein